MNEDREHLVLKAVQECPRALKKTEKGRPRANNKKVLPLQWPPKVSPQRGLDPERRIARSAILEPGEGVGEGVGEVEEYRGF